MCDVQKKTAHSRRFFGQRVRKREETQILETDPECRTLHSKDGLHPAYNIQTVADTKSHFITNISVEAQGLEQLSCFIRHEDGTVTCPNRCTLLPVPGERKGIRGDGAVVSGLQYEVKDGEEQVLPL